MTVLIFVVVLAAGLGGFVGGIAVGRPMGIAAERTRVDRIFDVAFSVVNSGALWKVQLRVAGKYTDEQFRVALVREYEAREQMMRQRRTG